MQVKVAHAQVHVGWKHNQVYTKKALNNYSHKVESKHFQSLSNHHGAKYWFYIMLYKFFWNFLMY
jgi:hypothetical protein